MKNLALRFLGLAMLGAACAFVFTEEPSVGKPVDDSVAKRIRGGSACTNRFTWDNNNPVYCPGREAGCDQTVPNTQDSDGGTKGHRLYSCGAAAGCGTFTTQADCARPTTDVATGIVMD